MGNNFHKMVAGVLDCSTKTFGEDILYIPKSIGNPIKIRAVFDENSLQLDPNTEALVATDQPMIGIKMDSLPEIPRKGDRVVRILDGRDTEYRVVDSREDGQGGASLLLHLVNPKDGPQ